MARYLIGVDLGTTNSALAYIDLQARPAPEGPTARTFPIPQFVALGELGTRPLLPSFLYLPGPHDLPPGAAALPWDSTATEVVGEFGRAHGGRVPGRLVTSAKSWLSHSGVDRTAPLLPWTAPADVARISPVEASARYLRHLVRAWNHAMAADRAENRLERLPVVLTVPASFDEVGRNLTVEAARRAGLEDLTLLEEPQAAFYCWLATHPAREIQALAPGARCLVIDVGGGTTDFSLIRAVEQQGELGFVREAVGDHLLLGGDNMDLALARLVESRLAGGPRLDAVQFGLLTQACRSAKEVLLGPEPPASYPVTVMGRGRQVVGGSFHATLTADDVKQVIFDGFFPHVARDARPGRSARAGLHEMGLPYVTDPSVTRRLAAFLDRHRLPDDGPGTPAGPDAVLFNGGVFQPASLRERVLAVMRDWFDQPGRPWRPLVLTNPSLDLAVAWGAARYAWLRHTGGRRIGGGIARSYYLAVGSSGTEPAPRAAPSTVLCIVPQGLEEGQEIAIDEPELELTLGQPVAFPLFTSTVRPRDRAGQVFAVEPEQLLELPPLHTILRGGKRSARKSMPVTLAAQCTEIGTLQLWCVAREGGNRWRLEFNVREVLDEKAPPAADRDDRTPTDVWPEGQVQEAARLIRGVYADPEPQPPPRELARALETALDARRPEWPTGLCRRLWDFVREVAEERRRSPDHLARWCYLAGYCLRPGFGDPLDPFRVDQLWKIFNTPRARGPGGPAEPRVPEGGADFWIMWRRVSGGLNPQLQQALFDRLRPTLLPARGKGAPKPGPNELAEMWRAAASLERLDLRVKEALGQSLLKQVRRSPTPPHAFWALTRLGARVLLYGPLNAVLHKDIVQHWLDPLAAFRPGHDSERAAWAFCLAQLARRTGQRALDVDDEHRARIVELLHAAPVPAHWVRMVEEVSDLDREEENQMFGDSLPIGLRLLATADTGPR